jgi:hypothetical protein
MSETKTLIEKIDEICPTKSARHSYFQLQYFVVGKEPTVQAKLRTCKIELLSRKNEIEAITVAIDDLYDKMRLLELHGVRLPESEMEEINLRREGRHKIALEHQLQELRVTLAAKEDEANFLIGLYEKLLQVEPEKDWDSLEVQCEYWNAKLSREIESRLMLGELPNIEDFKLVLSLPNGMPIKDTTLKMIQDRRKALEKQRVE